MSRKNECSGIPRGYRADKHGSVYIVKDEETGERVSLGFHEINFPRVKIGAWNDTLTKKNGYFVPTKSLPASFKHKIEEEELTQVEEEIYEAYQQSSMTDTAKYRIKNTHQGIKNKLGRQKHKKKNKQENGTNQNNKQDDSLVAGRDNYWTIVSARIAGVLDEETEDWYILSSYEDVSRKKLSSIESFEDAKSTEHPYEMTEDVMRKLENAQNIRPDIEIEKEELLEDLMKDEYSL